MHINGGSYSINETLHMETVGNVLIYGNNSPNLYCYSTGYRAFQFDSIKTVLFDGVKIGGCKTFDNKGGAAIWMSYISNSITLNNCNFTNNVITSQGGAAVQIEGSTNTVIISSCQFLSNNASSAPLGGGG